MSQTQQIGDKDTPQRKTQDVSSGVRVLVKIKGRKAIRAGEGGLQRAGIGDNKRQKKGKRNVWIRGKITDGRKEEGQKERKEGRKEGRKKNKSKGDEKKTEGREDTLKKGRRIRR